MNTSQLFIFAMIALSAVNAAGMRGPLAKTKQMQTLMEVRKPFYSKIYYFFSLMPIL